MSQIIQGSTSPNPSLQKRGIKKERSTLSGTSGTAGEMNGSTHFRLATSCSLLELLGLMMWIGGLAVLLTTVIPAVFNTLDMETGGRFLRRVFDGYNTLTGSIVVVAYRDGSFSILETPAGVEWESAGETIRGRPVGGPHVCHVFGCRGIGTKGRCFTGSRVCGRLAGGKENGP